MNTVQSVVILASDHLPGFTDVASPPPSAFANGLRQLLDARPAKDWIHNPAHVVKIIPSKFAELYTGIIALGGSMLVEGDTYEYPKRITWAGYQFERWD